VAARLVGLNGTDPPFVELAARSGFSLLDGASNTEQLAERAAAIGLPALALADRFDLGGAVRFERACREVEVRPIVGAEVLMPLAGVRSGARTGGSDLEGEEAPRRLSLVLLCQSAEGYHNLSALVTAARLDHPRGAPTLPPLRLTGGTKGLVCLLRTHGLDPACEVTRAALDRLRGLFPQRFWLALEHHGLPEDNRACERWLAFARREALSWVPVNAPRYAQPSGRIVHDVLICLRHGVTLDEAGDLLKPNGEWYLKGAREMRARWCFREREAEASPRVGLRGAKETRSEACASPVRAPGAPQTDRLLPGCDCEGCLGLARTAEIATRCTFRISELRPRLPAFEVPGGRDSHEFLRGLVEQGVSERYGDPPGKAERKQIEHELRVIRRLELEDYFLVMWDIVRFARREGILVQGRGSAANSAVCYCLGITAVDPVGLDLLFERFLSESRHEPPDIDLDIAHQERERVLQYVYERYGRAHAAMVCESITWRGKMAVRDAARVLGYPQETSDVLAAEVERSGGADAVQRLIDHGLEAAGLHPADPRTRALLRIVHGLEDLPRHRSIHVGGFVISDRPIGEIVPVERASMPDRTIIQWDKDDLDLPGFIKFDLLGLGMLTMLSDALRLVRETRGVPLDLAALPPDDPAVYDMICAADTVGVFQIESRAQMNTLPRVRPRCFYDLVIEVALIRPGPIQGDMVHPYLRRRRGEEPVTYLDPRLEPLLGRTLGVPLFQEQGMKVAIILAGFTPAQADNMRRAMGFKRSHRKMQEVERDLIAGLAANGVKPEVADKVLQYLTAFANYGFPESHSASFALLVYASAYLKRWYAPEFTCALLNAQPMGFYSPATIIHDARRHGVEVRPIDLAISEWNCTLEEGERVGSRSEPVSRSDEMFAEGPDPHSPPALRLGLRFVHGLGPRARDRLREARGSGTFRSVEEVVARSGLGPPELRVLAEAGAFESLWPGRRDALWEVLRQSRGDAGPLALRTADRARRLPDMSDFECVLADYRTTGLSTGAHPVSFLRAELARRGVLSARALEQRRNGERVQVAGLVICRQRPGTAKGVMFITLEDETGFANFVVMPDLREKLRGVLRAPLLLLEGVVEREGAVINVLVRGAEAIDLAGRQIRGQSRDFR
jgi:error-prone DNA polymerase